VTSPAQPICVAITGVCGTIGRKLRPALEHSGYKVIGLDMKQPSSFNTNVFDLGLIDHEVDISKPESLKGKLSGCTFLIHLASNTSPLASLQDSVQINIVGLHNILDEAVSAGVKRVIFASSHHAFHGWTMGRDVEDLDPSRLTGNLLTLESPFCADGYYGLSKVYGEECGKYYSLVKKNIEFVAIRIGWFLFQKEELSAQKGKHYEKLLRALWLSETDMIGFFKGCIEVEMEARFMKVYACSKNDQRVWDLDFKIYAPQDNVNLHF